MAFFKKLRDRLFKSSSKIEDGLDAIVGDGGVEEEVGVGEDAAALEEQARLGAEADAVRAEAARLEAEQAEAVRLADEAALAEAAEAARVAKAAQDEAARAKEERLAQAAREEEDRRVAQAQAEQEAAQAAAALAEEDRLIAEREAEAAAQAVRDEEEAAATARALAAQAAAQDAADRARLEAQEAARVQAARAADAERQAVAAQKAESDRIAAAEAEAKAAEEARAAREAADARRAEEAQQAHEAQLAEEARKADEARARQAAEDAAREAAAHEAAMQAQQEEDARLAATRAAEEKAPKPGLLGRLLGRGDKKTIVRRELDDDMLEQLEELLIAADMGVDTALRVTANMAEGRFGRKLSTDEIKELLAAEVTRIMEPVAKPMPLYPTKPQVVLVVGVNGSGKTTTIGKLASQFQAAGKKVVIAAGDTFRAAAVEQLQVWGDRAGVPVLTAPEGSDPASLAFDAMEQAARDGADLLMIDTAGRLQNRADLMEELSKIVRVIRKKDPDAPHNTLLVLDATTGQNALSQVKTFQELADVSGLVMTKLDGTAKGGVLVALADQFGLPIHAIGVGEQIDDLAPFDPEDFAAALTGIDR